MESALAVHGVCLHFLLYRAVLGRTVLCCAALQFNFGLCRKSRVMESALAMHDECLRSLLHKHCGYEVSPSIIYDWNQRLLLTLRAIHMHACLSQNPHDSYHQSSVKAALLAMRWRLKQ